MNQVKNQAQVGRLSSKAEAYEILGHTSSRIKDDYTAEQLLAEGKSTPLGKLLDKISKLPEVRFEKVLSVRRQICSGKYDIDKKLDGAVDNMLEDILIRI